VSARAATWVALLGGPVMWLVMLTAAYALVPWSCHAGHRGALWATVLVTLAAALAGLPLARRARAGAAATSSTYGFLSRAASWTTLGFALVIVASAIPIVALPPCLQ
jgi:hypothetical protein